MRDELSYMALAGLGRTKVEVAFDTKGMRDIVFNAVCEFYGTDKKLVKSARRDKTLCMCRHITTYLLRRYTNMSLKDIGEFLGGRDHTTSVNSIRQMKGWLETDENLSSEVRAIQATI